MMTDEQRDALRERNRQRAYACPRCGHPVRRVPGAQLDPAGHFAELEYKVCGGCGWDAPARKGKR